MDTESALKDERRTHILDAAAELLATKPTALLADIATYAGIGKATLHRYFANREALMLELAYRALDSVSLAIQSARLDEDSAPIALRRLTESLIPLGDKLYFLLNEHIWDVHPDLIRAEEATQTPIHDLIQRGQAEGTIRPDMSAVWMVYHLNFSLFAAWQAINDGSIAKKEALRLVMDSVLGGIATRRD